MFDLHLGEHVHVSLRVVHLFNLGGMLVPNSGARLVASKPWASGRLRGPISCRPTKRRAKWSRPQAHSRQFSGKVDQLVLIPPGALVEGRRRLRHRTPPAPPATDLGCVPSSSSTPPAPFDDDRDRHRAEQRHGKGAHGRRCSPESAAGARAWPMPNMLMKRGRNENRARQRPVAPCSAPGCRSTVGGHGCPW